MRGYFAIGIYRPKFEDNVGTLWRSAYSFGASYVFTIEGRYKRQPTDTCRADRHLPLFQYAHLLEFSANLPEGAEVVAVELAEAAVDLETFSHPGRAIYLLGPEDGSLPDEVLRVCHHIVRFAGRFCLNVAVAGSIAMYDRQCKRREF